MDEDSTTDVDNLEDQDLTSTEDENANSDDLDTTSNADDDSDDDTNDSDDDSDDDSQTSKFDKDLDEWAEKRNGKVPESDTERKALQDLRNSQREFTRAQAAKKNIEKGITDARPAQSTGKSDDPLEERLNRAEQRFEEERNLRLRSEYFSSSAVSDEEATVMGEILKEKVEKAATDKAKQEAYNYWTDPAHLEDWHDLAKIRISKGESSATNTGEIEAAAARKERARIAKESKANGSGRGASNTRVTEKTVEKERLERFKNWD